jgi:KDO2-lipid IV(A) lauroyltransferase
MMQEQMKQLLDLRYRIEYIALRLLIGFIRLIPLDRAAAFGAWLLRTVAPYTRRQKRAMSNLALAFPEKTQAEREAITNDMWDNLGRTAAEMMQIDRILADAENRIELESDYFVKRYKGKMGRIIIIGMHYGNWEVAAWPLTLCDANMTGVYRLVKNPYVDDYLTRQRAYLYPSGLISKGRAAVHQSGYDTARNLANTLRDGGRLGFLADRFDRTGLEVPFFGQQAKSTSFPAMLAHRYGARMWIGRCQRVGRQSRFNVKVRELRIPRSDDTDADIREVTAAIQAQFEEWIREAPGQYMWTNRRFS